MIPNSEIAQWTPFKILQVLGYLLGGILPIMLFIVLKISGLLPSTMLDDKYIVFFIIASIINFFIALVAFIIEHKYPANHIAFGIFFTLQAITSILLIHLLVMYTGGPKTSAFAIVYLYFPAIVGYIYGKGIKLFGGSILLSISYITNLVWLPEQKCLLDGRISNSSFSSTPTNSTAGETTFYLILFLIQIIVTTVIASESKKKDIGSIMST